MSLHCTHQTLPKDFNCLQCYYGSEREWCRDVLKMRAASSTSFLHVSRAFVVSFNNLICSALEPTCKCKSGAYLKISFRSTIQSWSSPEKLHQHSFIHPFPAVSRAWFCFPLCRGKTSRNWFGNENKRRAHSRLVLTALSEFTSWETEIREILIYMFIPNIKLDCVVCLSLSETLENIEKH
jgi:hypothetical protein